MTGPDPAAHRREQLSRTFVELADTLVSDFDVVGFLQTLSSRCVDLFGAASAGILLHDASDNLQVVASSDERGRTLELLELQGEAGPSLDAVRLKHPVQALVTEAASRWPRFASEASALGYQAVSAVPMRLRSTTVGALNLFHSEERLLDESDLLDAQAIADIATIGLLNEKAVRESRVVAEQLQHALTSRVTLEQAKGVLAVRLDCDVDAAFDAMRAYSRNHNQPLTAVARQVVEGGLSALIIRGG